MQDHKDILTHIINKKKAVLNDLKVMIKESHKLLTPSNEDHPHKFKNAISNENLSLIAEVKKASPSKGLIYDNFNPIELAQFFQQQNASALSVLTEEHYFLGNPNYINQIKKKINLPILRKDFIIHPDQIYESKLIGADAILLIKAILPNKEVVQKMLTIAYEQQLDVIMEIHDESEINEIMELEHLYIIGINNRNLKTFETNTDQSLKLKQKIKSHYPDCIIIAESGYNSIDKINEINDHKFDAVLIGEGLKTNPEILSFFNPQ